MKYTIALLASALFCCFGGMATANAAAPTTDPCSLHRHVHHIVHGAHVVEHNIHHGAHIVIHKIHHGIVEHL